MNNEDQSVDRIEALLKAKAYQDLNAEEKAIADACFDSAEAYDQARRWFPEIATRVATDESDLEPDPSVLVKLHRALEQRGDEQEVRKQSLLINLLPSNPVAAMVFKAAIAASLFWSFLSLEPGQNSGDGLFYADTAVNGQVWQDSCCIDSSSFSPSRD